jgi:hypothetical protein
LVIIFTLAYLKASYQLTSASRDEEKTAKNR